MKLTQNAWKKWGFIGNPFDTNALSMYSSLLPISQAFVGRTLNSQESFQLLNVIRNPGGGRIIIEGDIGIGKTTFVNYHRYLWENEAEDKLLTPIKEISVYSRWQPREFLMEILGQLSNKLLMVLKNRKKSKLLEKVQLLYEIFYRDKVEIEGSFFGFGLGYSKQLQINIPDMMESQLIGYLMDLVKEIKNIGYKGIFLHFDNLELLSRQDLSSCQLLFEEIRDVLQLPDIYYTFVAQKGFYGQVLGNSERVRSIMGWPIKVPPLTLEEVIEAINIRYNLLSEKKGYRRPVCDKFIETLYNIYGGKIRFIMDSVSQVINTCSVSETNTIKYNESMELLKNIIQGKIAGLSPSELSLLKIAVHQEEFTNHSLAKALSIKKPNVSSILKRFTEDNFIYLYRKEGRQNFYKVMDGLKVLQYQPAKEIKKTIKKKSLSIDKRRKSILEYLSKKQKITKVQYQKLVCVSEPTAKRDISLFTKEEIIKKNFHGRYTYYDLY